jgi:enamine deaminase RidA (YjgF/YER057c/UK114 family)
VSGTEWYSDGFGPQQQAGYSRAVRRGPFVVVSGTTATGPGGAALCPGDTLGQARICLQRVLGALAALGAGPQDVIRTGIYLAPGADWEQAAQAHREALGEVAPASTMLHVAALIGDGFCVEVEAMAVTTAAP